MVGKAEVMSFEGLEVARAKRAETEAAKKLRAKGRTRVLYWKQGKL